jgi:DnaJ like chaperone protein
MFLNGKLVGAFLGLYVGGAIGLIIGLALGYCYDKGWLHMLFSRLGIANLGIHGPSAQDTFFNVSFSVMGYIAKLDGQVSEQEISAARLMMRELNLPPNMEQKAMRLFYIGKQPNFNLDEALQQLLDASYQRPELLYHFFNMQMRMAGANHFIHPAQRHALENIANRLGIPPPLFRSYNHQYQRPQQRPVNSLDESYRRLNVSPQATNDEVKKAYRKLISRYHPDKLIAKKMSAEDIKEATHKTQQIQEAYDKIQKSRGL